MEKIICLGDSLTQGYGVAQENAWPSLLQKELGVPVINCGISGDTTAGMLARFYPQVVTEEPSHLIIMGGTNDLWWNVNKNIIQANIEAIARQAEHNGIIPVVGIPLPIVPEDIDPSWGSKESFMRCQKKLDEYVKSLKLQARRDEFPFLDFYSLFMDEDKNIKKELLLDGVHPTEEGHRIMALEAISYFKDKKGDGPVK